jgi:RNA polymerase sigma-70 factor (ECF subfamily)
VNEVEKQLLKSAKDGCITAFEQLITPYRKGVFNLMLKTCENEFEASQLAQEVFVRVFSSMIKGNLKGGFAVSIYRTADEIVRRNACKSEMIS